MKVSIHTNCRNREFVNFTKNWTNSSIKPSLASITISIMMFKFYKVFIKFHFKVNNNVAIFLTSMTIVALLLTSMTLLLHTK